MLMSYFSPRNLRIRWPISTTSDGSEDPQDALLWQNSWKTGSQAERLSVALRRERLGQGFTPCRGPGQEISLEPPLQHPETRLCHRRRCVSFPCGQPWKRGVSQALRCPKLRKKQLHLQLSLLWRRLTVHPEKSQRQ